MPLHSACVALMRDELAMHTVSREAHLHSRGRLWGVLIGAMGRKGPHGGNGVGREVGGFG